MGRIVLLTLALVLGIAAPASAGLAEVVTFKEKVTGRMVSQVRYTAARGENNDVTASAVAGVWGIGDGGAKMQVGAGCTLADEHTARCVNVVPAYYQLYVATGDRVDTVDIPPNLPNVLVDGGAGNDVLRGGAHVALSGGAGNDLIEFDATPLDLYCGGGNDLLGVVTTRRLLIDDARLPTCESMRMGVLVIAIHPRRRGKALALAARCVTSGPCRGSVSLVLRRSGRRSTALGRTAFRLRPGQRRRLRVALSARERRLLKSRGARLDVDVRTRNLRTGLQHRMRWRVLAAH
jgi:hypothetical protein